MNGDGAGEGQACFNIVSSLDRTSEAVGEGRSRCVNLMRVFGHGGLSAFETECPMQSGGLKEIRLGVRGLGLRGFQSGSLFPIDFRCQFG